MLLVAERFDRVQVGRFEGGVSPENNAYHGTDEEAQDHPVHGNYGVQLEQVGGHVPAQNAAAHADDAADLAEHDGLDNELGHDVAFLGADGAANPDLTGALGDRDEH